VWGEPKLDGPMQDVEALLAATGRARPPPRIFGVSVAESTSAFETAVLNGLPGDSLED